MQATDSYGGFDLQGSMRVHHHQQQPLLPHPQHSSHLRQGSSMVPQTIHENFPLTMRSNQEDPTFSLTDYNKMDRGISASDEDEHSLTEDAADVSNPGKGKKASPWQRVKWTDCMVRLLITAVSYISEEAAAQYGGGAKRKCANLQKKGKWKSVSKVMAERGHFVSPQQCEDKFNDLNKRYKRLNEILGRGTSCEVVENPALLDLMDHISDKAKEEVRKILSSKHLHYEEMCSYQNGNRLHLPEDPELQCSLRLALRSRDDHDESDMKKHLNDDNDEVDQEAEFDDHVEYEEIHQAYEFEGNSVKRSKQCQTHEKFSFRNSLDGYRCFNVHAENADSDVNKISAEGTRGNTIVQKQPMNHCNLQIEEQRLNIEMQMLELEKERFKWERFCRKKDRELEMMKMEIERMKLENERMAFVLKRKELGIDT